MLNDQGTAALLAVCSCFTAIVLCGGCAMGDGSEGEVKGAAAGTRDGETPRLECDVALWQGEDLGGRAFQTIAPQAEPVSVRVGDFTVSARIDDSRVRPVLEIEAAQDGVGASKVIAVFPFPREGRPDVGNQFVGREFTGQTTVFSEAARNGRTQLLFSCRSREEGADTQLRVDRPESFRPVSCRVRFERPPGKVRRAQTIRLTRKTGYAAAVRYESLPADFSLFRSGGEGPIVLFGTRGVNVAWQMPRLDIHPVVNQFEPYGFTGLRRVVHRAPAGTERGVSYFCWAQ